VPTPRLMSVMTTDTVSVAAETMRENAQLLSDQWESLATQDGRVIGFICPKCHAVIPIPRQAAHRQYHQRNPFAM